MTRAASVAAADHVAIVGHPAVGRILLRAVLVCACNALSRICVGAPHKVLASSAGRHGARRHRAIREGIGVGSVIVAVGGSGARGTGARSRGAVGRHEGIDVPGCARCLVAVGADVSRTGVGQPILVRRRRATGCTRALSRAGGSSKILSISASKLLQLGTSESRAGVGLPVVSSTEGALVGTRGAGARRGSAAAGIILPIRTRLAIRNPTRGPVMSARPSVAAGAPRPAAAPPRRVLRRDKARGHGSANGPGRRAPSRLGLGQVPLQLLAWRPRRAVWGSRRRRRRRRGLEKMRASGAHAKDY